MDWLAATFRYPAENATPVIMWSTFALSVVLTVALRKASWAGTGLLAAVAALVFFSVVFTVHSGVQSTGAIGSIFLWAQVSLVAFPAAGIVRIVVLAIQAMRAGPSEQGGS